MLSRMLRAVCLMLAVVVCLCAVSCAKGDEDEVIDEPVVLHMNTAYRLSQDLPHGEGC